MRYTLLLFLAACIPPHFDEHLGPSQDAVYIPADAVLDGSLQLLKTPWWVRFPADGAAAYVIRVTPLFGKHLDSGFDLLYGAALSTIGGCILKGILSHGKKCL